MAALTLQATKATGTQGVLVTRSVDDALGSAVAALIVDNTLTTLQVRELLTDLANQIREDWRAASKPAQLGSDADFAFSDDANFADGSAFTDQGGGSVTWLATLTSENLTTISRDNSGAIGSANMAVIVNASKGKRELWHYLNGIERELAKLRREFTSPADYPTTGSRVS